MKIVATPRQTAAPLIDGFGRHVTYLRLSVTDRCDFRCTYCMAENMTFLPKQDLLSLEELDRIASAFIARGVTKLRLTGGEPLVRRGIMDLIGRLARHLDGPLDELTLTTNASQLPRFADELAALGVRRINVSLDTLDADRFAAITRWGRLAQVLDGIKAAQRAGLQIKINTVAMKNANADELEDMIQWAHDQGMDISFIETMPLGTITQTREDQYYPLSDLKDRIAARWTVRPSRHSTGGPARYIELAETGGRVGFITPLSHNFCESCNRVRLTCTGQLYLCLGQDHSVDLRAAIRSPDPVAAMATALDKAMIIKPQGHDFDVQRADPAVARHMSVTGG